MNWFKKKFNRFFTEDIDQYEDDVPFDDEEVIEEEKAQETNKQRSFRFPIIADDEIDQFKHDTDPINTISHINSNRTYEPEHYKQTPSKIVYDVEVSGIRELLEQRRNGKGKTVRKQSIQNNQQPIKQQQIKQKYSEIEYKKSSKKQIEVENTEIQEASRRRFVPTQVPSPVHGFKKPSTINQLLEKNEQKNTQDKTEVSNSAIEEVVLASQEVASTVMLNNEVKVNSVQIEQPTHDYTDNITDEHIKVDSVQNSHDQLLVQQLANDELTMNDNVKSLEVNKEEEKDELYLESIDYDDVVETYDDNIEDFDEINDYEDELIDENELETVQDLKEIIDDEITEEVNEIQTDMVEELEEFEDVEVTVNDEEAVEIEEVHSQEFQEEDFNGHEEEESALDTTASVVDDENETLPKEILTQPLNNVEEEQIIHNDDNKDNKISSGSKIPFNVIMLKSDKEKLKLKQSLQKINPPAIEQTESKNDEKSAKPTLSVEQNLPQEEIVEKIEEVEDAELQDSYVEYEKPTYDYLIPSEGKTEDREWMESQADNLVESLSHFQVTAQIESIVQGPAVTQFEITVGHGTKVSKIKNLADDLKLALAAKDIRIQAPIPGKSSIGIEIPNRISRAVRLSEVVRSDMFNESDSPLEAALGLDLTGKPITIDLRKMPHGLIAGATGSGKSVCINSILVSLLYKADPHELKLMLIDPKVVELAPFNNIPHLVSPVITDVKTATAALKWAVDEMERRYQLFAHVGVRDLSRYNKQAEKNGNKNKLPYILIVIDELADLMMMAPSDVEESIARIAQKARACGIHLIVATQRPSVDVITGLIKSNIPTRIAFAVSSQIDSRTILDSQGAERLLGRGDMLYLGNGMSAPIRIQGTFVTDDEIEEIIDYVRSQGTPNYMFEHEELLKKTEMVEEYDELFEEVCRFVYEQGTASTSSIQRNYQIGYNRAARMMDLLEKNGFISEQRGSKPREVYITEADLQSMFN